MVLFLICMILRTLLISDREVISNSCAFSVSSLIFSSISMMFLITRLEGRREVRIWREVVSLNWRVTYRLRSEKWHLGTKESLHIDWAAVLQRSGAIRTPNIIKNYPVLCNKTLHTYQSKFWLPKTLILSNFSSISSGIWLFDSNRIDFSLRKSNPNLLW